MDKTYSQLAQLIAAFLILAAFLLAGHGFYDLEVITHFSFSVFFILSTILISLKLMSDRALGKFFSPESNN